MKHEAGSKRQEAVLFFRGPLLTASNTAAVRSAAPAIRAAAPRRAGSWEGHHLADGLALSGRAYFDTLSVAMLAG